MEWRRRRGRRREVEGVRPARKPAFSGGRAARGTLKPQARMETRGDDSPGVPLGRSEIGGGKGIRTPDLLIANETLYQLSYTPNTLGFNSLHCDFKWQMQEAVAEILTRQTQFR